MSTGIYYPNFELHLRRTPKGMKLKGTVDLPDGTIFGYVVHPPFVWSLLFGSQSGKTTVQDHVFEVDLRRPRLPWQRMMVVIQLVADRRQPEETRRLLGNRGEWLAADRVGRDYAECLGSEILEIEDE